MVPWGLQLLFYCFLYHAFPRDRNTSVEQDRQGRLRANSSEDSMLNAAGTHLSLWPGSYRHTIEAYAVCQASSVPCATCSTFRGLTGWSRCQRVVWM